MRHQTQVQLLERVFAELAPGASPKAPVRAVSVENYRGPARIEAEKRLFRELPIVVAHESQLREPGTCLTHDASGAPFLVMRDQEGTLRAFFNACRHRGARLLPESCTGRKGLTCRYHAWSYNLKGELIHIPGEEAFVGVDRSALSLTELSVEISAGLVFVRPPQSPSLNAYLEGVKEDLVEFGVPKCRVFRSSTGVRSAQWKLVVDAFLEGYHVKSLHQNSLYRFFLERGVIFDLFGPHVRSIGPRRSIEEAKTTPREQWEIRRYTTPFYFLFPNTILVFHPDSISLMNLFPEGPDKVRYLHSLLVQGEANEEQEKRWEKTFSLIDGVVFQMEDLAIAESVQSTLSSEANQQFVLGSLEYPIWHFHQMIDRFLQGQSLFETSR